jgi:RNA-directed DNA polymerase
MSLLLTRTSDELRALLQNTRSLADLARLLELSDAQLLRYSYGRGRRYQTHTVKKRRGGMREIHAPDVGLKIVQQRLNQVLQSVYRPHDCVYGFVRERSVARNAQVHQGRRWVLNLDLKDFFPTIHFGRVQARLQKYPFNLPYPVATVVAQLCTWRRQLPQGAPTSPVVSNIVAGKLDADLLRLARKYRCTYTRYADDIVFSTDSIDFPAELAETNTDGTWTGSALKLAIEANGFEINTGKVRLSRFDQRQEVTGLTANAFPNVRRKYIRRIRAMLNAWEHLGYEEAERRHNARFDSKTRPPHSPVPSFRRIVKGHIDYLGMVRGIDDRLYRRFLEEYAAREPSFRVRPTSVRRRNHLLTYKDAVWILECETPFISQGTAFELAGFGLVTCAHVILDEDGRPSATDLVAFQPRAPHLKVPVRYVRHCRDRDIAVLELANPSGFEFKPKYHRELWPGMPITVAGFPSHTAGARLWHPAGVIENFRPHLRSPRYIVSVGIVGGASGGPVLDKTGAVIGIASQGAASFEGVARRDTIVYGVIPISLVHEV